MISDSKRFDALEKTDRIAVTGAGGFLGSFVLEELSKVPADQHSPSEVAEQQELHDSIVNAIHSLPTPQSNCVVCQAPEASTTADLQGAMWQRMALSMRTRECMQATRATFFGLPAWRRCWYRVRRTGLNRTAAIVAM